MKKTNRLVIFFIASIHIEDFGKVSGFMLQYYSEIFKLN